MKLSPRQQQVLQALADGMTVQQIAGLIGVSNRTAEHHIFTARKKLGGKTTPHAVAIAIRKGRIT